MIITNILNVDDYCFDVFMSISAATTGFDVGELQSTGMGETYYRHILDSVEEATFIQFLNVSAEILENSHSVEQLNIKISEHLIAHDGMNELLEKIITVWYLGTWNGTYVNAESYPQGLAWKTFHGHPPGAKQPGFKSWNVKPVNAES
ncbi:MAG: hypothetical protein Crog4KO_27610 [Crocinitomicaceae bacterium]